LKTHTILAEPGVSMKETETVDERTEQGKDKEKVSQVDFKMVTFTLAGRDYALDIMKVKEISKANKFTYVPNAAPFVRGVYNLRGDIISVIDLRIFFNQVNRDLFHKDNAKLENMIILRLEDHVIAVIVDTIEKVVGVNKEEIQPPHPLFGDINIKYINGVVEKNDTLYVILDVEKIFNSNETSEKTSSTAKKVTSSPMKDKVMVGKKIVTPNDDINLNFILESLQTFKLFYPSVINQSWVKKRFQEWSQMRANSSKDVQFSGEVDAREFLQGFPSPFTDSLWDKPYADKLASAIEKDKKGNFTVWNPGCGKGFESYSIAVLIKQKNPDLNLKILSNDNDLINISTAPGLVISKDSISDYYQKYMVESSTGHQFSKEIKSSIVFEYHDIIHDNNLPPLDMIVIRDVLSYLPVDIQKKVFEEIEENIKPGGILVLGVNEVLPSSQNWKTEDLDGITINRKK